MHHLLFLEKFKQYSSVFHMWLCRQNDQQFNPWSKIEEKYSIKPFGFNFELFLISNINLCD